MKKIYCLVLILLFNVHLLKTSNIEDKNNVLKYGPEELIKEIAQKLCYQKKSDEIAKIVEKRTINQNFNTYISNTSWYLALYNNRVIQDLRYTCFDESRVIEPAKYQNIYGNHLFNWFPDLERLSSINSKNVQYYTEQLNISPFFKTLVIKEHKYDFSNQDKILGIRVEIGNDGTKNRNYANFDDLPREFPIMLELPHGSTVVQSALDLCDYFREKNIRIDAIKFPYSYFCMTNSSWGNFFDILNNVLKNDYISFFLFYYGYLPSFFDDYFDYHFDTRRIAFYGDPYFPLERFHNVDSTTQLSRHQEDILTYFIENGLLAHLIELIASTGRLQLLPLLKKYGANFNAVSSKYKPLLCYSFDNLYVLKELIKLGTDPNAQNFQGDTAIAEAIKQLINIHEENEGRFYQKFQRKYMKTIKDSYIAQVITLLIEQGAKPISCPDLQRQILDKFEQNPVAELFDAVKSDNYFWVMLLLVIGTKVNGKNEHDRGLLCYIKSKKTLYILIKNGLKIDNTKINEAITYLGRARGIESRNKRMELLRKYFRSNKK